MSKPYIKLDRLVLDITNDHPVKKRLSNIIEDQVLILLGNSGYGKSSILENEFNFDTNCKNLTIHEFVSQYTKANSFSTINIDSLDLVRIGDNSNEILGNFRAKLSRLNPHIKVRISCNSTNWIEINKVLQIQNIFEKVRIYQLLPLTTDEINYYIKNKHGSKANNSLVDINVDQNNLSQLLNCPQNIDLFIENKVNSNNLTKIKLFDKVIQQNNNLLLNNYNLGNRLSSNELINLLKIILTVITLSKNNEYKSIKNLLLNNYDPQVLDYVFNNSYLTIANNKIIPCCRSLTEYFVAKFLLEKEQSNPRIINILYDRNKNLINDLLGVYAWIATLKKEKYLITKYPSAIINNGDVTEFNNHEFEMWFKEYINKTDLNTIYLSVDTIWENINIEYISNIVINIVNNETNKYQLIKNIAIINKTKKRNFDKYLCNLMFNNEINDDVIVCCLQVFNKYKQELCNETITRIKEFLNKYSSKNINISMQIMNMLLNILYPKYISIEDLTKIYLGSNINYIYWEKIIRNLKAEEANKLLKTILKEKKIKAIQYEYINNEQNILDLLVEKIISSNNNYDNLYKLLVSIQSSSEIYYSKYFEEIINSNDYKHKLLHDLTIEDNLLYESLINIIIYNSNDWISIAEYIYAQLNNCSNKNKSKLLDLLFKITYQHYTTSIKESNRIISEIIKDNDSIINYHNQYYLKIMKQYEDISHSYEFHRDNKIRNKEYINYSSDLALEIENNIGSIKKGQNKRLINIVLALPINSEVYKLLSKKNILEYINIGCLKILEECTTNHLEIIKNQFNNVVNYNDDELNIFRTALKYLYEQNKYKLKSLSENSIKCILAYYLTSEYEDNEWIKIIIENNNELFNKIIKQIIHNDIYGENLIVTSYIEEYQDQFTTKQKYNLLSSIPIRLRNIQLIKTISKIFSHNTINIQYQGIILQKINSKSVRSYVKGALCAALVYQNNKQVKILLKQNFRDKKFISGFIKYFYYSNSDRNDVTFATISYKEIHLILKYLLQALTPINDSTEGIAIFVSDEKLQQLFILDLINKLRNNISKDNINAIDKLIQNNISIEWKNRLIDVKNYVNHQLIYTNKINYNSNDILDLLENDQAISHADLQLKIIEILKKMTHEYRNGKNNQYRKFWDNYRIQPKIKYENDIRDLLAQDLEKYFQNRITREEYLKDDKRVDIEIIENKFMIPIEIKKQSSVELTYGLNNQLLKYIQSPDYNKFGIILIIWTEAIYRDSKLPNKPNDAKELQELFDNLVDDINKQHNCNIVPYVMDLSIN